MSLPSFGRDESSDPLCAVVSPGILTSSRAVAGLPARNGHARDDEAAAVERGGPAGRGAGRRRGLTVPSRGEVIVRSKLALEPGATAIDGYGVVTAKTSAAVAAGTSPTRNTAAVARAIAGRRTRAIRDVGKGPLRQSDCIGPTESAKRMRFDATSVRFGRRLNFATYLGESARKSAREVSVLPRPAAPRRP